MPWRFRMSRTSLRSSSSAGSAARLAHGRHRCLPLPVWPLGTGLHRCCRALRCPAVSARAPLALPGERECRPRPGTARPRRDQDDAKPGLRGEHEGARRTDDRRDQPADQAERVGEVSRQRQQATRRYPGCRYERLSCARRERSDAIPTTVTARHAGPAQPPVTKLSHLPTFASPRGRPAVSARPRRNRIHCRTYLLLCSPLSGRRDGAS